MKINQLITQIAPSKVVDHYLLATEEEFGGVVGLAVLGVDEGDKAGWISRVFVDDKFRNKGIGRELVQTAIGICRAQGLTFASLSVADNNEAAQHLYKSLGFMPFMKGQDEHTQYVLTL